MKIDAAVAGELRAHALEAYPDECCGAVIVDAHGRQQIARMRNVQDEMRARDPVRFPRTARVAYCPDPSDFKRALDRWESAGHGLAAFYHSHPDHDAYFSEEDVLQATAAFGEPAYPDAVQIVLSVYGREVRAIKAFVWSAATQAFVETPIDVP